MVNGLQSSIAHEQVHHTIFSDLSVKKYKVNYFQTTYIYILGF